MGLLSKITGSDKRKQKELEKQQLEDKKRGNINSYKKK